MNARGICYRLRRVRNLFRTPRQIATPTRLLVIAAHPDDAEAGCGATVAKLVKQDAEAYFLVATNGNKGDDAGNLPAQELAAKRWEEQRQSAQLLGVYRVEMLGRNDGELFYSDDLRRDVVEWIRRIKPDIVFTHDSSPFIRFDGGGINHADHRAIGQAAIDACYPFARGALQYPEHLAAGLTPHTVRELYLWNSLEPNHWEDVTTTALAKLDALTHHLSQYGDGARMVDYMRDCMRVAGTESGFRYAEAFRRFSWS